MPLARSQPSEITGENAIRSRVASISSAICSRLPCRTAKVIGSTAMSHATSSRRFPASSTVAAIPGSQPGSRIRLLDNRRPSHLYVPG